jgi:hypothetical protein
VKDGVSAAFAKDTHMNMINKKTERAVSRENCRLKSIRNEY